MFNAALRIVGQPELQIYVEKYLNINMRESVGIMFLLKFCNKQTY